MLGISLYSYHYLKLAKSCVFLIIPYAFSSTKLENRFCPEREGGAEERRGGDPNKTMYTHVSKCKNDKKKKRIT
jgi:hypothetical protein